MSSYLDQLKDELGGAGSLPQQPRGGGGGPAEGAGGGDAEMAEAEEEEEEEGELPSEPGSGAEA